MEIRKATTTDVKTLTRKLQNKRIEYNTVEMMKKDVKEKCLWILIDNNTIVASCAVVPTNFYWMGVKRLVTYNKKIMGKVTLENFLKQLLQTQNKYIVSRHGIIMSQ